MNSLIMHDDGGMHGDQWFVTTLRYMNMLGDRHALAYGQALQTLVKAFVCTLGRRGRNHEGKN